MAYAPSITAKPGYKMVLAVGDGSSPSTFLTVSGLKTPKMTINNNPADITNAGSQGFKELLPDGGVQSFQVSGDGIFDGNNAGGIKALFTAAVNRTVVEFKLTSGHGDFFVGYAVVSQCDRGGPHDNAETFTVTLDGTGHISYFP